MRATAQPHAAVLQIEGLYLRVPQGPLFANFSASVPPGVTWLSGGEGAGKTTLLRLMAGAMAADAGRLQLQGVSLSDQAEAYRGRVFWADPRSDALDAITPLAYWSAMPKRYPAFNPELLADLIDGFDLAQHQEKALYMLSTGSRRKVWLAAAFASGAALTLLDEPFAALDRASIRLVLELLQEAASHAARAWLVAGYEAPPGVPLAGSIALDLL
jgi:ABC-type multidrug transport system ATPase subunit